MALELKKFGIRRINARPRMLFMTKPKIEVFIGTDDEQDQYQAQSPRSILGIGPIVSELCFRHHRTWDNHGCCDTTCVPNNGWVKINVSQLCDRTGVGRDSHIVPPDDVEPQHHLLHPLARPVDPLMALIQDHIDGDICKSGCTQLTYRETQGNKAKSKLCLIIGYRETQGNKAKSKLCLIIGYRETQGNKAKSKLCLIIGYRETQGNKAKSKLCLIIGYRETQGNKAKSKLCLIIGYRETQGNKAKSKLCLIIGYRETQGNKAKSKLCLIIGYRETQGNKAKSKLCLIIGYRETQGNKAKSKLCLIIGYRETQGNKAKSKLCLIIGYRETQGNKAKSKLCLIIGYRETQGNKAKSKLFLIIGYRETQEPGKYAWKVVKPEDGKYTTEPLKVIKLGGRNEEGRVAVRTIGGGSKKKFRWVDNKRHVPDGQEILQERVEQVRYSPCHVGRIALVASGLNKRWITASQEIKVGDLVTTHKAIPRIPVDPKIGDAHPVGALPLGTLVHNIEIIPGKGGQYVHSAGSSAQILRKLDDGMVTLKLPSKQEICVKENCMAVVGTVLDSGSKFPLRSTARRSWVGLRPRSGWWHRKDGYCGFKNRPTPPMKVYDKPLPPKSRQYKISMDICKKSSAKKKMMSIELKREIIEKHEQGVRVVDLSGQYGRSTSMIYSVLKRKESIKSVTPAKGLTIISKLKIWRNC
ncbi:MRPL2 [Cordylochernes scorpioides]|uniref:MRPL2 n=1 Tax=Cordylochernes scorpioides TaxID=51811 RepID=A0ABY6LEL8_9ARAC|nr:MRPL2 [Cordylochernes scorpioides]